MTEWPTFPVAGWAETRPTLHRWTQIVGKIRLALAPPVNHYWHSTLYVSTHGLTTSPMPYGNDLFEIGFDFVDHELTIDTSWAPVRRMPLAFAQRGGLLRGPDASAGRPGHRRADLDDARRNSRPHAVGARPRARCLRPRRCPRILANARPGRPRLQPLLGSLSRQVQSGAFLLGALDLAITRFSGRRAPMYSGGAPYVHPHVMHESYSHEVSSAGFWPGDDQASPQFYCYAVPAGPGFNQAAVQPAEAGWYEPLGEFVLPYSVVQASDRLDEMLMSFLQSTYEAAATTGGWDRELLEQRPACACTPEQSGQFRQACGRP